MSQKRTKLALVVLVAAGALGAGAFFLLRGGSAARAGAQSVAEIGQRAGGRTASGAPPIVSINGVPTPTPATDDERRAAQVQRMYRARLVQRRLEDLKASSSTTGVDLPAEAVDKSVREIQAKLDQLEETQN